MTAAPADAMPDIVERLRDLHRQATTERSHYYVANCVQEAIAEIERLRAPDALSNTEAKGYREGFADAKGRG